MPGKCLITLATLIALACPACRPSAPSFDSPKDEFVYLCSLQNPSPSQWKRRKELAPQIGDEFHAQAEGFAAKNDRKKALQACDDFLALLGDRPEFAEERRRAEQRRDIIDLLTLPKQPEASPECGYCDDDRV
jgi:hypothetical protein